MSPLLAPAQPEVQPEWWLRLPANWQASICEVLALHGIDTTGWAQ